MKIPFYRNGLIIGLLLFLASGFVTKTNNSIAGCMFLSGITVFTIALIKRLIYAIKGKQRSHRAANLEPPASQPTASPAPPVAAKATIEPPDAPVPAVVQKPEAMRPVSKEEGHKVAGTSYHRKEIESLGDYNSAYDMTATEIREEYGEWDRVYQYIFCPSRVVLVPEPENEYDSNAIRVEVDGQHIGYIKRGSNAHIRKLINENRIIGIRAAIGGGRYKQLDDEGHVTKDSTEYYARLTIKVTEEN